MFPELSDGCFERETKKDPKWEGKRASRRTHSEKQYGCPHYSKQKSRKSLRAESGQSLPRRARRTLCFDPSCV